MSSSELIRRRAVRLTWAVAALACTAHVVHADGQSAAPVALASSPSDLPTTQAIVPVPEPSARAVSFYSSGNSLWLIRRIVALAVPSLLLLGGLAQRLKDWSYRVSRRPSLGFVLFVLAYFALSALLELPLTYYLGFARLHEYGLSTQSLGSWASEELKEYALSMLLAVPALAVVYGLMRRNPRRWWIAAGLLAAPVLFFLALIKPIWIDPLFDEFGPMRDKQLESRILKVAARSGIDADRVYEVAASRKTRAVNAYVTGLLGTKRIVLWDTLIDRLEPDQVVSVMGHEMGHYVLNHVLQGVVLGSLLILAGLALVSALANRIIARWGPRLRIECISDPAGLPLLAIVAEIVFLVLAPVGFAYSRHIERESDRFSLELLRDNQAAARSFVSLADTNLGFPRPGWAYTLLRATHPSLGDRIDFCNEYKPWQTGQPMVYGHLMRPAD